MRPTRAEGPGAARPQARPPIVLLVLLGACRSQGLTPRVDTDGDGIYDDAEAELGTDPTLADSDADGLSDGAEATATTDPLDPDTDGDSYLDGDEVRTRHDPLDPDDRIYTGYWPYNADKDALGDTGWTTAPSDGTRLPRFAWTDQFGDPVDDFDFAAEGVPTVVMLAAAWCAPCEDLAALVAGEPSALDGQGYDALPGLVQSGSLRWITVLDANADGRTPTESDLAAWAAAWPSSEVPVLGDPERALAGWLVPTSYPAVVGLTPDLRVTRYSARDAARALTWAASQPDAAATGSRESQRP